MIVELNVENLLEKASFFWNGVDENVDCPNFLASKEAHRSNRCYGSTRLLQMKKNALLVMYEVEKKGNRSSNTSALKNESLLGGKTYIWLWE